MTFFIILFFVLLLVPDICIWLMLLRQAPLWAVVLWWLPTIAALVLSVLWFSGFWSEAMLRAFFVILMCFALPKLLFMLFALAGKGLGLLWPSAAPVMYGAGIVVALLMLGCSVCGFTIGLKRLEVKHVTIDSPSLPAEFDGYRIVHISDLHAGTFGKDSSFIAKMVERANALNPDAIVFTGDIVNSSAAELKPHIAALSQLHSRDGIFSVLGNHDYCQYARYDTPNGAERNKTLVIEAEKAMGWTVLMNEHRLIRRGDAVLAIAGVENVGRPPFPSRGNMEQALGGIPYGTYTILLSHDPTHWRREVLSSTKVALMLAGHTHAMQFQLFGFSPSALSYKEWGGLYTERNRSLYISKGVGGTAPFRFGAWPEITEITFKKTDYETQTRLAGLSAGAARSE